jgi:hypothetical protein
MVADDVRGVNSLSLFLSLISVQIARVGEARSGGATMTGLDRRVGIGVGGLTDCSSSIGRGWFLGSRDFVVSSAVRACGA